MNDDLPEPTLAEVAAFLNGAASLRGVYFGQKPPGECAAFWWREHLRKAVAQRDEQIAKLTAEVEALRALLVRCRDDEFGIQSKALRQDIEAAIDAARAEAKEDHA